MSKYKFIDLFAGIGGFHLALSKIGMECVFASEIDKDARQTYLANYNIDESLFNDDIRKISPSDIPDHDILCAGFPCQPFSQAGKKLGFEDGTNSERGNLFFCIADILYEKRPKAFILENVRHLVKHDNGNTFKVIQQILKDLDYSIYYKILKASEFGRPQHRPRVYIVGFDNRQVSRHTSFEFPKPIPLKLTMSDIWEGKCDREIGFTLRVGGRGSQINDRRNWDAYRVNGEIRQLKAVQGKRMMGYPDNFKLPTQITKSMKQLGNSVCVDVIEHIVKNIKSYLENNIQENFIMAKNKGEWSELYVFFKLLIDNQLHFGGINSEKLGDYVTVLELAHNHNNLIYQLSGSFVIFKDLQGNEIKRKSLSDIMTADKVRDFFEQIKNGRGASFDITSIHNPLINAEIPTNSKGRSFDKGDLNISFENNNIIYPLLPVGIKSNLGSKPTLLNASSATNFIFKVNNISSDMINTINSINTSSKVQDRILKINEVGGTLDFIGCELETHTKNLLKIDSKMPEILAEVLLKYYSGSGSKITDLITDEIIKIRFKDYLKSVLLGMFYTKEWDGNLSSTGSILVKKDGNLQLYHILKDSILKDYLFYNTKLDTPSSTRHRFGSLYKEKNGIYLKLNLQIRIF